MGDLVSDTYGLEPECNFSIVPRTKARKEATLEINDLLQVQFPDEPNSLSLRSRVDDLVGDKVHIAWPTERGIRAPIRKDQTLTISFVRDDAVYAFTGIVEHMWRAPLAQLSLLVIGPPRRIQRRQFFRVKSLLPVEFYGEYPSFDDVDADRKIIAIETHTYEISGSGLAIRNGTSIPAGTLLECRLHLAPENARMKILCKVVHSSSVRAPARESLYHVGMFFVSIRESDRTRIVRHVFTVERSRSASGTESSDAPAIGKMRVLPPHPPEIDGTIQTSQ
jgi:c-di-GMP-binding flagellar brake protein YcgR